MRAGYSATRANPSHQFSLLDGVAWFYQGFIEVTEHGNHSFTMVDEQGGPVKEIVADSTDNTARGRDDVCTGRGSNVDT